MFFGIDSTWHVQKVDDRSNEYVLLVYTFPMVYRVPQMEIVCKRYALGKLTYQLPPSGPTNLLVFHLLGLGFWMFRVFSFMFYVKKAFGASLYSYSCE
jgi:hypothetical protein